MGVCVCVEGSGLINDTLNTFYLRLYDIRHGHTNLTHSYILKKDPPPQYEHCQCILTVRHVLVEFNHLARTRNDIFGRCCVVESFKFHPELILKFLRDTKFY